MVVDLPEVAARVPAWAAAATALNRFPSVVAYWLSAAASSLVAADAASCTRPVSFLAEPLTTGAVEAVLDPLLAEDFVVWGVALIAPISSMAGPGVLAAPRACPLRKKLLP